MTKPVTIHLLAPPSSNRIWRVGTGGRVHIDAKYASWRRSAGWELQAQRPGRFPAGAEVAVTLRLGPSASKRVRDIDNAAAKGVLDLLQSHQVIANDKLVADLRIVRDAGVEPGRVQVEVRATASGEAP
jgi:Holliday junction resolvase RusA-like endonuclease